MQKGDIDNGGMLPRILVTWEAITEDVPVQRKFLGITTGLRSETRVDRAVLSTLWNYADRVPVRMELINYGVTDEESDRRFALVDRRTSPFRSATAYEDIQGLLDDCVYMPDVVGILDIPENQGRYGGRGMGFDYIARVL